MSGKLNQGQSRIWPKLRNSTRDKVREEIAAKDVDSDGYDYEDFIAQRSNKSNRDEDRERKKEKFQQAIIDKINVGLREKVIDIMRKEFAVIEDAIRSIILPNIIAEGIMQPRRNVCVSSQMREADITLGDKASMCNPVSELEQMDEGVRGNLLSVSGSSSNVVLTGGSEKMDGLMDDRVATTTDCNIHGN